ncbi:unnamed protein product, partial [Ixodes hexagonus]
SLFCVISRPLLDLRLIGHLCSHVIYWAASYHPEDGFTVPGKDSFGAFLLVRGKSRLLGIQPLGKALPVVNEDRCITPSSCRKCDFVFFVTHAYAKKMVCRISRPSSCRLTDKDVRMMVG